MIAKSDYDSSLLPIIGNSSESAKVGKRGRGRWRALSLIVVHLLIFAHIAHYLARGRTLSPVEPSESMYTIELSRLTAGAIFFALAIASTMIFGRFFCGWGCHLVALQDLCSYALKKFRLRPAPLRSRMLAIVPYGVAFYMFLWPSMVRMWRGMPRPAWTNHLLTDRFWGAFPGPFMAIVTLVVCGGVIVYLLGNKGFCTYVCPYGAFFAVADRMALGRIRVTDACAGCGQCTAACTSNVRVHAEVRDFGMVLDSSCMKCMDCVSVCPNDALYFGFSSPSRHTGARPTGPAHNKTYDFTLTEDLLALAVAGFTMFAMRGLYDGPPFLLAVALGVINGFLAVAIIRLARRQNAHLASFQVRRAGRLTRAGKVAVITAALWFAFVAHSFSVQYLRHQGMAALRNIHITWEESASPRWTFANASDHDRRNIHLARASLEKADNFGLLDWSDVKLGLAWIAMLQGDREIAATYLGEAIKLSHESEQLREMLLELRS